MTPLEILETNQIESNDIEAEIRARHQLVLHGDAPCPTGCCQCGDGCDTRHILSILDQVRAQFIKHRTTTHKVDPKSCLICQESDIVLGMQ